MRSEISRPEPATIRRPFAAWSVSVPVSFAEAFVDDGGYWHAYDEHRSVSLTSVVITAHGRPVPAEAIVRQLPPIEGTRVHELPSGLRGWAVAGDTIQPARASQMLSGMLAVNSLVLIATITSDDLAWARMTRRTIRAHRAGQGSSRS